MPSISTARTIDNVEREVYRSMCYALDRDPVVAWDPQQVGQFTSRDDLYISKDEQKTLNPFMERVANDIRKKTGGMCPSKLLYQEACRRMKLAVRSVAGDKETQDGKLLAGGEIDRIKNPYLKAMVWMAATNRSSKTSFASRQPSSGSSVAETTTMAPVGPHYYDDMPVDGPLTSDDGWGPDGPSRRTSGGSYGPDGRSRSTSGAGPHYFDSDSGGGTDYIGAMPIF